MPLPHLCIIVWGLQIDNYIDIMVPMSITIYRKRRNIGEELILAFGDFQNI